MLNASLQGAGTHRSAAGNHLINWTVSFRAATTLTITGVVIFGAVKLLEIISAREERDFERARILAADGHTRARQHGAQQINTSGHVRTNAHASAQASELGDFVETTFTVRKGGPVVIRRGVGFELVSADYYDAVIVECAAEPVVLDIGESVSIAHRFGREATLEAVSRQQAPPRITLRLRYRN